MRDLILDYQIKSRSLEPELDVRRFLIDQMIRYSEEFLETISDRRAYDVPVESAQGDTLIGQVESLEDMLSYLRNKVDKNGINPASPGHLGYVPGGGIFTAAIGDFLAAVTNRYSGLKFANPGAVHIENELIEWSRSIIGYPDTALGNISSGGSIANLIAITCARDKMKIKGEKIYKSTIYLTQQTHHCIQKAIRIAGLEDCPVRTVALDEHYRMDTENLRYWINKDQKAGLQPFLIIASCGSTDTGAIDPLERIGGIAQQSGAWYHIDAAYGGYFCLCGEMREKLIGMDSSDSIVMDPHKTLFLPYGSGVVIIKEGKYLFDSFHYTANYLQDANPGTQNISPADLSPELTKHFRGLRMWIPLKLHGTEVFQSALYEKHLLTKYFYEQIQKLGFEVGPPPDLSICIYRYVPKNGRANEFNTLLVKMIQEDGRVFVSSTTLDQKYWIRIAVVCFRTHLKTIDLYISIIKEKLSQVEESMN